MSDEQRAPYTPPRDGPSRDPPLQFDPRGARDARPMPMTLIASGVVLAILIGGVVLAYAGGFHRKTDPARTVGDRVLVMKTAPAASPADQTIALNRPDGSAPSFAAASEEPAPRPKPQLQVKAQSLPPVRIASGEPEPAAEPGATPSVQTSTLLPTTVPTAVKPRAPATRAPAKSVASGSTQTAASAKAATPARAAAEGGGASVAAGVQIGAFSSHDLADKGFADVGKLVSTSGHGKRIEAVERGGSTLYRATVTGFADRDAAKTYCEALTAKGHACIVKG